MKQHRNACTLYLSSSVALHYNAPWHRQTANPAKLASVGQTQGSGSKAYVTLTR